MGEHVDVLIVGAGLSGIGAAHHLQRAFPSRKYVILESRDTLGGTWDLFRYPGVRSDSDMQTLGYRFRPWTGSKSLADGPSILRYVRDTAAEAGIDDHIRYGYRVTGAAWSSADTSWTVEATRTRPREPGQGGDGDGTSPDGHGTGEARAGAGAGIGTDGAEPRTETVTFTCNFLLMCTGYYRYDHGYQAELPGLGDFRGQIVHPQFWPEDLDCAGKRVAVVGSGATAVTLVPALAETAGHVTMVQRSPTYIISLPTEDPIDAKLRRLIGTRRAYTLTRWKNVAVSTLIYQLSQQKPAMMRGWIRGMTVKQLPAGYDVDTHFKPRYGPWDQRLCLVPDGDLFQVIRHGRASIATGTIDRFTEHGIRLASGQEIAADIVITATGLQLLALGGVQLTVDGRDVNLPDTMAYKGLMLSGVPNFALTIGYTNASWTLKADLTSEYVVRLLRYMERHGYDAAVPVQDDSRVAERPLLDFAAGYILRSMHEFPKSGSRPPWRLGMSYLNDVVMLRHGRINDGVLRFSVGLGGSAPQTPQRGLRPRSPQGPLRRRGAAVARAAKELVR